MPKRCRSRSLIEQTQSSICHGAQSYDGDIPFNIKLEDIYLQVITFTLHTPNGHHVDRQGEGPSDPLKFTCTHLNGINHWIHYIST